MKNRFWNFFLQSGIHTLLVPTLCFHSQPLEEDKNWKEILKKQYITLIKCYVYS